MLCFEFRYLSSYDGLHPDAVKIFFVAEKNVRFNSKIKILGCENILYEGESSMTSDAVLLRIFFNFR